MEVIRRGAPGEFNALLRLRDILLGQVAVSGVQKHLDGGQALCQSVVDFVGDALALSGHAGRALGLHQLGTGFHQLLVHPAQRPEGIGDSDRHQGRYRWAHNAAEGQPARDLHQHGHHRGRDNADDAGDHL